MRQIPYVKETLLIISFIVILTLITYPIMNLFLVKWFSIKKIISDSYKTFSLKESNYKIVLSNFFYKKEYFVRKSFLIIFTIIISLFFSSWFYNSSHFIIQYFFVWFIAYKLFKNIKCK